MGAVLRFPTERVRGALIQSLMPEPAEILILPSVRVERGEGVEGLTPRHRPLTRSPESPPFSTSAASTQS